MYQDVRFLNKEERRQFLISSVSERDWKREHRLELLIVSIFQMQVKFSKVCSPFCSTAGTVSKKIPMGGTQNFLQDVKRNINALCVICGWHGRVTESAQENQLTQDLELLMQVMDSRLQSLAKLNSDFHYQGNTEESSQVWPDPPPATRYPSPVTRHPPSATRHPRKSPAGYVNAERPRYEIRQEQIHELREALGFRWVDIARMLAMSPRTRSWQRQEFGMPLGQQYKFSSWFDTWTILWEALFQLLHCEFCVVLASFCIAFIMKVTV